MPIIGLVSIVPATALGFRLSSRAGKPDNTPAPVQRNYDGAGGLSRLVGDWRTDLMSASSSIRGGEDTIRARARDLERNVDLVQGTLRKREINIVGAQGITLQSQIKKSKGRLDEDRNTQIENAWLEWCQPNSCDVTGCSSFAQLQALIDRRKYVDGGILIRRVRERRGRSPVALSLQLIEVDRLSRSVNRAYQNGTKIEDGIEVDQYGRPVAYHIQNYQPGDLFNVNAHKIERIPASEIIYFYKKDRPTQNRGVSSLASVLMLIRQLHKYQQSEVVAARSASSWFGFLESDDEGETAPKYDTMGNLVGVEQPIEDVEPGMIRRLSPGEKFNGFAPMRPNQAFAEFWRAIVRSYSVGVGQSYESSSGDFSQSNFSSTRQSLMSERDYWRCEQAALIQVIQHIYEWWIEAAYLSGVIDLQHWLRHESEYAMPKWVPRGWDWVDPTKDSQSVISLLQNNLTTVTDELAKRGLDINDVYKRRAQEIELAKSLGLSADIKESKIVEEEEVPSGKELQGIQ